MVRVLKDSILWLVIHFHFNLVHAVSKGKNNEPTTESSSSRSGSGSSSSEQGTLPPIEMTKKDKLYLDVMMRYVNIISVERKSFKTIITKNATQEQIKDAYEKLRKEELKLYGSAKKLMKIKYKKHKYFKPLNEFLKLMKKKSDIHLKDVETRQKMMDTVMRGIYTNRKRIYKLKVLRIML
uniref:Uncharacterized protein n=1 Tax=Clastoptera arizonana TaxID=38151 RepID=A0A1B6C5K1_9HEMI